MWALNIAYQHRLLYACCRGLRKPVSTRNVGSKFAFYHGTTPLSCPEDSSINPVVRRRRVVLSSSGVQHRSVVSDRWQDPEKSSSKPRKKEKVPQKQNPQGHDRRVSSELRKLSQDDFTEEWEKPVREKKSSSREDSYEIVFGISPCLLALNHGRRKARKLFVKDGEASHRTSVLRVCEEAHRRGVQVQRVSKQDLDRMSCGRVHQGVCLQASPLSYLSERASSAPPKEHRSTPLWLVLDGIQDPMNLGAILRTAYFLGVDRVASSVRNSCPLTPVVSKASSGVMEIIGVYGYESLEDMLKLKVAQGWQVIGTVGAEAEEAEIPVARCSDFRITMPTLLLMGGEGLGLTQKALSHCQTLLTIPAGRDLHPGIESLNVSVATGILLHSLLSNRTSGN